MFGQKKLPFPTVSIISKCNNNCCYCFQRENSVQNKKEMVSFDDIKKIVAWVKNFYPCLIVLGGEPLLHPDIVDIMRYISEQLQKSKIITNLITLDEQQIVNLIEIKNMNWLINVTPDKKNKDVFDKNIRLLFDKKYEEINYSKQITFSLTLTGIEDIDFYYIDNLIDILKKIPQCHRNIRFTPQMPNNENSKSIYVIRKYDKQYLYLLKRVKNEKINISAAFDCGMNNYFISEEVLETIRKSKMFEIKISLCSGPFIDITTDLKVLYCHYSSQKYFPSKYYYEFDTPEQCLNYFIELKNKFSKNYSSYKIETINNKKHYDFCPAIMSKILKKEYIFDIMNKYENFSIN